MGFGPSPTVTHWKGFPGRRGIFIPRMDDKRLRTFRFAEALPRIDPTGGVMASDRASGPPDAPISPLILWTREIGPSPIGVQESRGRPRTARSKLVWDISADMV